MNSVGGPGSAPLRSVVVGTDGSSASADAVQWAVREAGLRRRPLCIVRVFDPVRTVASPLDARSPFESQRIEAETSLSEAVGSVDADVDVSRLMVRGSVVRELCALAVDAEMVVVGSRGHGGIASLLLGSTSLKVALHASCPVVVVRPHTRLGLGPSAGRVVAGVDGGSRSEDVLEIAFAECELRGVGLTAVHTYLPPDIAFTPDAAGWDWPQLHELEESLLAARLAGWRDTYPDVDVVARTVRTYAAPALIAESLGATLVVFSRGGRGRLREAVVGSACGAVLHHAECPVLVVPVGG